MEAILFIGIQGSGKSSFFRERFFHTHVRLSLDLLRTRHREGLLLHACVHAKAAFVVDNTNPTVEERARYLAPARAARFRTVGYVFDVPLEDALRRNAARTGREVVPEVGVKGTLARLQRPTLEEGFDALFRVTVSPWASAPPAAPSPFTVEPWR